jgi:hypothetical protein
MAKKKGLKFSAEDGIKPESGKDFLFFWVATHLITVKS